MSFAVVVRASAARAGPAPALKMRRHIDRGMHRGLRQIGERVDLPMAYCCTPLASADVGVFVVVKCRFLQGLMEGSTTRSPAQTKASQAISSKIDAGQCECISSRVVAPYRYCRRLGLALESASKGRPVACFVPPSHRLGHSLSRLIALHGAAAGARGQKWLSRFPFTGAFMPKSFRPLPFFFRNVQEFDRRKRISHTHDALTSRDF